MRSRRPRKTNRTGERILLFVLAVMLVVNLSILAMLVSGEVEVAFASDSRVKAWVDSARSEVSLAADQLESQAPTRGDTHKDMNPKSQTRVVWVVEDAAPKRPAATVAVAEEAPRRDRPATQVLSERAPDEQQAVTQVKPRQAAHQEARDQEARQKDRQEAEEEPTLFFGIPLD